MKSELEQDLVKNWHLIQARIEQIASVPILDIKQISDLDRYILMQKDIAGTLMLLQEVE